MAQTKKRRKRKHRGTQGGQLSQSGRRVKPQNRAEAVAQGEARRKQKAAVSQGRGPTWTGAVKKGLFAGVLFFVMMALLFGRGIGASLALAAVMLIIYIPLSYQLDGVFHRRRMQKLELERIERAARRKTHATIDGKSGRKARDEPEGPAKRAWFKRRGGHEPGEDEPAEQQPRRKRDEDEPAEKQPRGKRAKAKPAEEPANDQGEEELTWEDAAAPPPAKRSLFKGRF